MCATHAPLADVRLSCAVWSIRDAVRFWDDLLPVSLSAFVGLHFEETAAMGNLRLKKQVCVAAIAVSLALSHQT